YTRQCVLTRATSLPLALFHAAAVAVFNASGNGSGFRIDTTSNSSPFAAWHVVKVLPPEGDHSGAPRIREGQRRQPDPLRLGARFAAAATVHANVRSAVPSDDSYTRVPAPHRAGTPGNCPPAAQPRCR